MAFQKGQSGNPGGRPKADYVIKDLARQHTDTAIKTLVAALNAENEGTRVAAAKELLDRGWGKAHQTSETHVTSERMVVRGPEPVKDVDDWIEKHVPKHLQEH